MFYGNFMSLSVICMIEILRDFITSLGKLDPKTTSCKACNKFKLHFSSSLSEGKTQCKKWQQLKVLGIMPDTGIWQQLLALKLGHQKMLPEQGRFSQVSELSPCLAFATESVNELFKLLYFNLFKYVLGYLSPLAFFSCFLLYCQFDYFCYLE